MKKKHLLVIALIFAGFMLWAQGTDQAQSSDWEEIDFLLFMPDSGSMFVNDEEAAAHLDSLAVYIRGRNPSPAQIHVYGYTAQVINDIDDDELSLQRARHVMGELQRRGLGASLFAEPRGFGAVDTWGSNDDEEGKSPNRRVRILLDGEVLSPQVLAAPPPPPQPALVPASPPPAAPQASPRTEPDTERSFPWWILLILAILGALLFFALKGRKKPLPQAAEKEAIVVPEAAAEILPAAMVPVAAEPPLAVPPLAITYTTVTLDEEIRFRAYERYLERYGQSEDHVTDWFLAIEDVSGRYIERGYEIYSVDNSWWARRQTRQS